MIIFFNQVLQHPCLKLKPAVKLNFRRSKAVKRGLFLGGVSIRRLNDIKRTAA